MAVEDFIYTPDTGGFLLVDKPLTWTSFNVVGKLRIAARIAAGRKMKVGHAGTLDPLATGLLIVAYGPFTKKLPLLQGADASHAWFALWCPQNGWVALDPTNNIVAGLTHVTLAWGRDYGDVAPLRGVIRGGSAAAPQVEVSVTPA